MHCFNYTVHTQKLSGKTLILSASDRFSKGSFVCSALLLKNVYTILIYIGSENKIFTKPNFLKE
jgi:hypothetical protein